jgi:uncharacterized membrane protein YozB (DUF420 family)
MITTGNKHKNQNLFLIILLILNGIVLLGQLWPEGAPPFARTVNIITMILNIIFVFSLFRKKV